MLLHLVSLMQSSELENEDVADFQTNSSFTVADGGFQNRVVIFNTAKAPDDLETLR